MQDEIIEILSKEKITRHDLKSLKAYVFNDSYFYMSEFTNINPTYLKEIATGLRIMTELDQDKILNAALLLSIKRPKITVS